MGKGESEIRLLNSAFKPEDDGGNLNFKATHKDTVKNLDGKFLARVRDFNAPNQKKQASSPLKNSSFSWWELCQMPVLLLEMMK